MISISWKLLLLLAAMAFFVFRIARRFAGNYGCPEPSELKDFYDGRLRYRPAERQKIVTHLGKCSKCRAVLDEIRQGKPLEDHMIE